MASVIEPYRGVYYSAKSALDELDIDAINAACDEVDLYASDLHHTSYNFYSCESGLSKDALSINDMTFETSVDDCCAKMTAVNEYITSTTSEVRSTALDVCNRLQESFNAEAEEIDRRMIAQHQQQNN